MNKREKLRAILSHPIINQSAMARAYYEHKGGGYRCPSTSFHLLIHKDNVASDARIDEVYDFVIGYIKGTLAQFIN